MSAEDPVEAFYGAAMQCLSALGRNEPSLELSLRAQLSKGLVLAAASAFEFRFTTAIESRYRSVLTQAPALAEFAINTGLKRRYHTYFSWTAPNANQFFGLFGSQTASRLRELVSSTEMRDAMRDFLRLGNLRNELAHRDFAAYSLDLTLDEVIDQYRRAAAFLEAVLDAVLYIRPAGQTG